MSAILLISCKNRTTAEEIDPETLITQQSENLVRIESLNGEMRYRFETPLMERYELATQPYVEFRKGVKVETFNDTTHLVESDLIADYAKFIEPLELWEARGNVRATNANGQILETQQLFWDQRSDRIFSNVDSKITQGTDVIVGIGFESNSKFDDFTIRRPRGQVAVETETSSDSTQMEEQELSLPAEEPVAERQTPSVDPAPASSTPGTTENPEEVLQPLSRPILRLEAEEPEKQEE